MIHTRHIRHDWRTFNDRQDQRTVKTLCNVKTRPGLAGIPGITTQRIKVPSRDGKPSWGWCVTCAMNAYIAASNDNLDDAPDQIKDLYDCLIIETEPMYHYYMDRLNRLRASDN